MYKRERETTKAKRINRESKKNRESKDNRERTKEKEKEKEPKRKRENQREGGGILCSSLSQHLSVNTMIIIESGQLLACNVNSGRWSR